MAVANHPYFPREPAVDNDGSCEAVFGMFRQSWKHGLFVMPSDTVGGPTYELFASDVLGHTLDVAADELHGISAVRAEE